MSRQVLATMALVGILVALVGCGPKPTPTPEPTATPIPADIGTIVIGKVGDAPVELLEEYQPLANYLAANLDDFGIGVGMVKVAPDIETMAGWIASGEVHVYFDNAYATAHAGELCGGRPIVLRVKEGPPAKQGAFFTLPDSDLTSLADLEGRMIALEEPHAIVSYMAARAYLIEAGLNPVEKEGRGAAVAEDEVGYVFSGDDDNTIEWVLDGRVVAGVVDSEAFNEFLEESPGRLILLAETEPLTRNQPGLAPADIDPALAEAITNLLVGLAETEEGPDILAPSETQGFIRYAGEAKAAVDRVAEMYTLIQNR